MTEHECEQLAAAPTGSLLEGPRWSAPNGRFSWVDIPTGRVFLLDPATEAIRSYETGIVPLGAALPLVGGEFELIGAEGIYRWQPESTAKLVFRFDERPELISNDANIDPWGRRYVGRMAADEAQGAAELMAIELDGSIRTVASGLTIPNGLAWSADQSSLYFVESVEQRVYRVPTGAKGESWHKREVLIQHKSALPDGICIGPDGNLWVACFGGARVEQYSLEGMKLGEYPLPVSQVTACEFVGDDLYVTTAAEDFTESDWRREPLAGSLFRFRTVLRA